MMRKTQQIVVAVEDPIHEAFSALARRNDKTLSALGRDIIIRELVRLDLLPQETLIRIA